MSDIETRLREALGARADLVQPEHLSDTEPPRTGPTPWFRRSGVYLAAVAAVLVIVLPLAVGKLGLSGDDDAPLVDNAPDTGEMRFFGQQDVGTADVDGDGADDEVRLVEEKRGGASQQLEVALSSTGEAAGTRVRLASLAGAADLDGRPGAEIIAVDNRFAGFDTAVQGRPPTAYTLRDGELVDVIDYEYDVRPGPTTLSHWWVEGGELRWWRTHEPYDGSLSSYSVDLVRFVPSAERLVGQEDGTWCVDHLEPEELFDCDAGP